MEQDFPTSGRVYLLSGYLWQTDPLVCFYKQQRRKQSLCYTNKSECTTQ